MLYQGELRTKKRIRLDFDSYSWSQLCGLCKVTWMERLRKQFAFLGRVERGSGDRRGPEREREREDKPKLKQQDRATEIHVCVSAC